MYSKIKSIVSEFVQEHDLASKAKMDENFLTDMLTVRLFDGLSQKEPAAPKPRSGGSKKGNDNTPVPGQTSILSIATSKENEVAK